MTIRSAVMTIGSIPNRMRDQRQFFTTESLEYFRRNYEGRDLRDLPLVPILDDFLSGVDLDLAGGSILDIGCGAGNNLNRLCRRYGVDRGVGTEPSAATVEILTVSFPELEFYESSSNTLPFATEEFDLVLLRSVLHWVDRNYLLQTVGEAIRVASRYLIVSDFAPSDQYSTVYRHRPEYRTFKVAYRPLVEAAGFMRAAHTLHHWSGDPWNEIETVLYERQALDDAFPLRTPEEFGH